MISYVKEWVDKEYESGRVTSLTDEELLQLIDLEHKNLYIYERIQREIERGERAGWPETYDIQRK